MKLTNNQIYSYAIQLNEAFNDATQRLPMKINFYLQKNKETLTKLAQEIENNRMDIIKNYGTPVEEDDTSEKFAIPADKLQNAQQELADLLSLEQEVNIYMISVGSLSNDINLTTAQMEALLFMID